MTAATQQTPEAMIAEAIIAKRPYRGRITIEHSLEVDREKVVKELRSRGKHVYAADQMTHNPKEDNCVCVTVMRKYRAGGGAFALLLFKDLTAYHAYIFTRL